MGGERKVRNVEENIGKRVKVYFYDSPSHVTCKFGILKGKDDSFVVVETGNSVELIAIRNIVRAEVLEK